MNLFYIVPGLQESKKVRGLFLEDLSIVLPASPFPSLWLAELGI